MFRNVHEVQCTTKYKTDMTLKEPRNRSGARDIETRNNELYCAVNNIRKNRQNHLH